MFPLHCLYYLPITISIIPTLSRLLRQPLQVLRRRISLSSTTSILPDVLLAGTLVGFESLDLRAVHMLHDLVGLPLLEAEAKTLMRVVLVVRLILVVLDLDEIAVDGSGVEGEGDESVDGGGFGDDFEGP